MSDLPIDVLRDILSRLPVKTLLRFRCISKPFCALIDSSEFIKMHLNRSAKSNSNLSLVLTGDNLYAVDFASLDNAAELNHPFKCSSKTLVMGSCNGLLLLRNIDKRIAMLNPSTRKYHNLPDTPLVSPNCAQYIRYMTFGFGYDSINDDYKVVRIVQDYYDESESFSSEVKVYSLKSNSWRRIQDFPYYLCLRCEWGVLACGALHWVGKQSPGLDVHKLIIAFDIGVEEFRLVPQPQYLNVTGGGIVEVLGGSLCVTCSYYEDSIDLWVMKDYGVMESWTKLLSIVPPSPRISGYAKPLAYSKSGDEILFGYDENKLLWFDLTGKMVKEVTVHGLPYSFHEEVFVGSLVPLDGYIRNAGGKQLGQEERKEKKNKKRDDFLSEGFKLVL